MTFVKGHMPWNKGKPWSEDVKNEMSATRKGRPAWNKGIPNTWYNPKGLEIGRGWWKGRKQSKEMVEKLRLTRIGRKVSLKTREKMSIAIKKTIPRGEKHYKWNPNRLAVRYDRRNDPEYKQWRKKVYARDFYKCKMNNKDCKGHLNAHHILVWEQFPELRYEINNGITLCQFHHPKKRIDETKWAPIFQKMVPTNVYYFA